MLYEVRLNQVPISFNAWQTNHWAKNAKLKKEWIAELAAMAYMARIPKCLAHMVISAEITFSQRRTRDTDNYASVFFKMTQDGFVDLGYVLDDNPKYITMGDVHLKVDKGKIPNTLVKVEATEGREE